MRNELYIIFRNALLEAFSKYPDSDICCGEMMEILGDVFENMLKDGDFDGFIQE